MTTQVLDQEQIRRIHVASLRILERTGVDQASSLDMLILQNEVIAYVESVLRETAFSDDDIGLDLLDELGPGGTFINQEHTVRRLRRQLWFPSLLDREFYQAWKDAGALATEDRCRQRKEHLLATATAVPLPADVEREIARVIAAAQRHLAQ